MSKQPRDDSNYPIPVLGYRLNGSQQLTLSASSTRSEAFSIATRVVSIYATVDSFFEVGNATVIANNLTSHFIPAGMYIDISLGADTNAALNAKYIAAITQNEGMLYISERS